MSMARALKKEQDLMRARRACVQRHRTETIAAELSWQIAKDVAPTFPNLGF